MRHVTRYLARYRGLAATCVLLALLGSVSWLQARATRIRARAAGPTVVAITQASTWPVPDAEVETMVRQAVQAAGGLAGIQPGMTVVVKPNLVMDADPADGFTTDPRVARAVVRLAREAGAGNVIIAEGSGTFRDGHESRGATLQAFRVCGYDADGDMFDDETGAPLVDLNEAGGIGQHDPAHVAQVSIPDGLIWQSYWLPRTILEADYVISVPVFKNHNIAGVTLGLKNEIGIAPSDIYHSPGSVMYKGALGHGPNDLGQHIIDLNLARPIDFVVIDALRGMTDGPNGGTLIDPPMRLFLAGPDPVAADTVGALVMGYDPASIPYLGMAAEAGLGINDVEQIVVRGHTVRQVRRDFPTPYGDPPVQRADPVAPAVQIISPEDGALVSTTVTIEALATDDRAIARVEFYAGDQLASTLTQPPYRAVVDLSQFRGQTVALRALAFDRALNDAEATVSVDVMAWIPEARVEPLPLWVGTAPFTVTWASPGPWVGEALYQVQTRDGYEGQWTDWLTGTRAISASCSSLHGHTTFFRARVLPPRQPAFPDAEWGQAFTTVLTEPAPVLVTSRKAGWRASLSAGDGLSATQAISYHVLVSNTGNLAGTAVVTDPLPAGMVLITETLGAEVGLPPSLIEGVLYWSGTVEAGESADLTFALSPTAAIRWGDRITNTVQVAGSVLGPFVRQGPVVWDWPLYLPVLMDGRP